MAADPKLTRRKQFHLDPTVLFALETLHRNQGASLDQLADEAFRSLLKRYNQPLTLAQALRDSTRSLPANDRGPKRRRSKP